MPPPVECADRRDTIQAEVVEQLADVGGLRADVERHAARLLGGAQPEQVRHDHAVAAREDRGQPAPQVRRQREPVQQQHGRAGALIEIGELAPRGDESVHAPSRTIASDHATARARLGDVVHAHDVGAVRRRHHATAAAVPSTRAAGSSTAGQRADEPLARGADHHRGTEVARRLDGAKQRQVVVEVLAEPDARVDAEVLRGDAREHGRLEPLAQELVHLGHDVVVVRLDLHRLGSPFMCISTRPAPASLTTRTSPGRRRRRRRSRSTRRPSTAASATAALRVSTLTGTRAARRAAPRSPAEHAGDSSSAATGAAPGRVDSPPTSRMSAPSSANRSAVRHRAVRVERRARRR